MRKFESFRLGLRAYANSDSEMQRFESSRLRLRVSDGLLEQHCHRHVDQMTRAHVDIVVGKMADKPGAGIILLKRIRTLIRYAMALGWTDRDPTDWPGTTTLLCDMLLLGWHGEEHKCSGTYQ